MILTSLRRLAFEVWSVNPRTGKIAMHGRYRSRERALRVAASYRAAGLFARVERADVGDASAEREAML